MPTFEDAMTGWLLTRPPIVQEAARRWPLGLVLVIDAVSLQVFGWTETAESERTGDPLDLMIILTPGDPFEDYADALERRVHVCARHLSPAGTG